MSRSRPTSSPQGEDPWNFVEGSEPGPLKKTKRQKQNLLWSSTLLRHRNTRNDPYRNRIDPFICLYLLITCERGYELHTFFDGVWRVYISIGTGWDWRLEWLHSPMICLLKTLDMILDAFRQLILHQVYLYETFSSFWLIWENVCMYAFRSMNLIPDCLSNTSFRYLFKISTVDNVDVVLLKYAVADSIMYTRYHKH